MELKKSYKAVYCKYNLDEVAYTTSKNFDYHPSERDLKDFAEATNKRTGNSSYATIHVEEFYIIVQ